MITITLQITGMTCASCAATVQHALMHSPAITDASVNIATNKAKITYNPDQISMHEIHEIIAASGYGIEHPDQHHHGSSVEAASKTFWYSLVFGLPLLYLAMRPMFNLPLPQISSLTNHTIQFLLTTAIILVNLPLYRSGLDKLYRLKPNMDSLVVLGTLAAYFYSLLMLIQEYTASQAITTGGHVYFESAGLILVFIALGKYLEELTKSRTSAAISQLLQLQPDTATVIRDAHEQTIAVQDIVVGEIIITRPGDKIALDGIITDGESTIDESAITGESIPVYKHRGDTVIGGTINQTSVLHYRATAVGDQTVLAQIVSVMENAIASKAPIQKLADTVSLYFVPAVIIIAMVTFGAWLLLGYEFGFALTAAVSVLIIACPCALGLATPAAVMMGTGLAAKRGILIKDAAALETAGRIDTFVFDKTGTLTAGKPVVERVTPLDVTESELISLAGTLAHNSAHPLSRAVDEYLATVDHCPIPLTNWQELEGRGITAQRSSDNAALVMGNQRLMTEQGISIPTEVTTALTQYTSQGLTPLLVAVDQSIIGIIGLLDTPKPHTKAAIQALRDQDKQVWMITGDHQQVAQNIADQVGITKIISEVMPQDKYTQIQSLQSGDHLVAMVGDGINDAPALAQSDLGIAFAAGTDIARESGDMILMRDDLRDVVVAIDISDYTQHKIRQNLFWAFIYNLIGIPLAAGLLYPITGSLLSPMIAALAMSLSSVSVVTNALMMRLYKSPTFPEDQ